MSELLKLKERMKAEADKEQRRMEIEMAVQEYLGQG